MTNQNFPRRLLDDAIDHAVRELVHADARPGFRRRVLDRIHQPKARGSWWPALLIPATAVAVMLFAIVVLRQPSLPADTTVVGVPTAAPLTGSPAAGAVRSTVAPPNAPRASAPRRELPEFRFGPRTDRVTATSVATAPVTDVGALWHDNAVSAPAPIAVAPLAEPTQIVVRPITFSRIDAAQPSGSK